MFDAVTAGLLRSAPELPGLDPNNLPAILTAHYAELASIRLKGNEEDERQRETPWSLERIADTYELVVSLHPEGASRAAAAFVAGTAQQILAKRQTAKKTAEDLPPNINRDRLDPSLAAVILFMASGQYADANEAASNVTMRSTGQSYEARIISEHIVDIAKGQLTSILKRAARWRRDDTYLDHEDRALAALLEALCAGIELLAAQILRADSPESIGTRFNSPEDAFKRVISLASSDTNRATVGIEGLIVSYAGPYHLASLLLAATRSIALASILNTSVPLGADAKLWGQWLRFRAEKFPYLWSNHREALEQGFHQTAVSSVVVLPTGAGKTTLSSFKIAGVLARGKKVVFLAPTHALVEQLTEDLQEMFPEDLFSATVSSDFDLLMLEGAGFKGIEVMTPERCLAMLSFAPDAFSDVGLLVFDECHLLSPEAGKIRRAFDAMLCVLAFCNISPDADLLFLSAMLKDGVVLASWLQELTGRTAISVDLLWKPSRQARGVIIYKDEHINEARTRALAVQEAEDKKKSKSAKALRKSAAGELTAIPYTIWGLQHNWLAQDKPINHCITTQLLERPVPLTGHFKYGQLQITPNVNHVAIEIAVAAATRGLKTIVFVNTKRDAVLVANEISTMLTSQIQITPIEQARWDALKVELGGIEHSILSGATAAVPHNSAMLRLERDIAERMFRRSSGAHVIVATPTLAQGLNLPAQLAILAGDKRANTIKGGREDLKAHEILNAAARAGRAGHLANGLVLLIPEPIISFQDDKPLGKRVTRKLQAILPEDDHCVEVTDPLEIVLDRVMQGLTSDPDVSYMINRMAALRKGDEADNSLLLFDLRKSFGAFIAKQRGEAEVFDAKVEALKQAIAVSDIEGADQNITILSSQSGLPANLLINLKTKIILDIGALPTTVCDWLRWMINWLQEDKNSRNELFADIMDSMLAACGKARANELEKDDLDLLLGALIAWVDGKPLREIEEIFGGSPDDESLAKKVCPRARELAGIIVQRGISFAFGLVACLVKDVDPFTPQETLDRHLVDCLATLVRRGFNNVGMLSFAASKKELLGRVQIHEAWKHQFDGVC